MSCVVGLIYDQAIYMGSDGIATTDEGEKRPIKATKLFKNGKYLMGFSGSVRAGQVIFARDFKPPEDIYKLPDEMREHMSNRGTLMIGESQVQMFNGNFLIGFESKLYEILMDFQLNETLGNYTAIGSGAAYALGSLYSTKGMMISPRARVEMALEAACEYDMSCGKPLIVEMI
ncbi:MAG: hypothetical protein ACTSX1_15100 [Candidatus Heimdallarchaeaceae archaeon]